MIYVICY